MAHGRRSVDHDRVVAALPAYEIGRELGHGAWGVVIAARHVQLRRDVAIKQLPLMFGSDRNARARFIAEARLLASLDHPHIVPIYDYVEHEGLCLLVMERLAGGTVSERARRGGFSAAAAIAVGLSLCAALDHAHGRGVLHRDVKPDNLMFTGNGVLKVTDFGIAKVLSSSRTLATRTGDSLGTPAYMSPEQFEAGKLTPATDLYSAGTVIYELLAGRLPFADQPGSTPIAMAYARVHGEQTPLAAAAPNVPGSITTTIDSTLARDPDARYPSAESLGVALGAAAAEAWGPTWLRDAGVPLLAPGPIADAAGGHGGSSETSSIGPTRATTRRAASGRATSSTRRVRPVTSHGSPVSPAPDVVLKPAAAARPRAARSRRATYAGGGIAVALAAVATLFLVGVLGGSPGAKPSSHLRAAFTDDFSDNATGWTQRSTNNVLMEYREGQYRVVVRVPNHAEVSDTAFEGEAANPALTSLADVAIEADARPVGDAGGVYGLACRGQGQGKPYYAAVVDATGFWGLYRTDTTPVLLKKGQTPGLVPGSGAARLRLDCRGGAGGGTTTLTLSVDGKKAGEGSDAQGLPAGRAGLYVATRDKPDMEVRFDNVTVSRPS